MNRPTSENSFARIVTMEAVVGAFVALMFLALAIFTIIVSGSALFQRQQFPIKVVLPDAMGLRRNDAVIARGTTVGTVDEVYFDRDGVHVRAMLTAPVVLREGYRITVVSTSILGGRQLVLFEGEPEGEVVEDVLTLVGEQPSDMMDDATAAIRSLRDFLAGEFLENLRLTGANLADVSERLALGEGTLGRLLVEEEAYEDLRAILANARGVTERLDAGESTLGRLLAADTQVYDDIASISASLRDVAGRLERGEGTLGRLLSEDDAMYEDLRGTLANLRSVTDRLERGESSLGKLLAEDTQAYDDLAEILSSFREISGRLAQGEGTLGMLLSSDRELYDNINGAVKDVREAIDDLRETAPISTFSSFIFGAF